MVDVFTKMKASEAVKRIQQLINMHGDLEFCRVGHYGEIHEMTEHDICFRNEAYEGTFGGGKERSVFEIYPPDIGPEPD